MKGRTAGFARWELLPALAGVLVAGVAFFTTVAARQVAEELAQVAEKNYRVFYRSEDYDQQSVKTFAQQRASAFQEMARRLGVKPPDSPIRFFLYTTYEQKASQDFGRAEFYADPEAATVAAVWNEVVPQVELLPDAMVFVAQA